MPTLFSTPTTLLFPVRRSPLWNNLHQVSASGKDNPVQLYSYPRWEWEIEFSALNANSAAFQTLAASQLQYVAGFYNSVGGSAKTWLWDDADDRSVTDQSFGTGDASTTQFALVRTFGGFVEPVFSLNGAPAIKKNGVLQTAGVDYTVGTAGLITFAVAPAAAATLTWTGLYYWVVRFNDDSIDFSKFTSKLYEIDGIKFTSCKLSSA